LPTHPSSSHALDLAFRVLNPSPPACTATSDVHECTEYPHRRPFHGVSCSTTLSETGSDLHRVYLTRLCSAFGLSRPLDALLRPQPSSLVSCWLRPRASAYRGFPLPIAATPLDARCPSCRFPSTCKHASVATPGIHAFGRSVHDEPVLSGDRRPILS